MDDYDDDFEDSNTTSTDSTRTFSTKRDEADCFSNPRSCTTFTTSSSTSSSRSSTSSSSDGRRDSNSSSHARGLPQVKEPNPNASDDSASTQSLSRVSYTKMSMRQVPPRDMQGVRPEELNGDSIVHHSNITSVQKLDTTMSPTYCKAGSDSSIEERPERCRAKQIENPGTLEMGKQEKSLPVLSRSDDESVGVTKAVAPSMSGTKETSSLSSSFSTSTSSSSSNPTVKVGASVDARVQGVEAPFHVIEASQGGTEKMVLTQEDTSCRRQRRMVNAVAGAVPDAPHHSVLGSPTKRAHRTPKKGTVGGSNQTSGNGVNGVMTKSPYGMESIRDTPSSRYSQRTTPRSSPSLRKRRGVMSADKKEKSRQRAELLERIDALHKESELLDSRIKSRQRKTSNQSRRLHNQEKLRREVEALEKKWSGYNGQVINVALLLARADKRLKKANERLKEMEAKKRLLSNNDKRAAHTIDEVHRHMPTEEELQKRHVMEAVYTRARLDDQLIKVQQLTEKVRASVENLQRKCSELQKTVDKKQYATVAPKDYEALRETHRNQVKLIQKLKVGIAVYTNAAENREGVEGGTPRSSRQLSRSNGDSEKLPVTDELTPNRSKRSKQTLHTHAKGQVQKGSTPLSTPTPQRRAIPSSLSSSRRASAAVGNRAASSGSVGGIATHSAPSQGYPRSVGHCNNALLPHRSSTNTAESANAVCNNVTKRPGIVSAPLPAGVTTVRIVAKAGMSSLHKAPTPDSVSSSAVVDKRPYEEVASGVVSVLSSPMAHQEHDPFQTVDSIDAVLDEIDKTSIDLDQELNRGPTLPGGESPPQHLVSTMPNTKRNSVVDEVDYNMSMLSGTKLEGSLLQRRGLRTSLELSENGLCQLRNSVSVRDDPDSVNKYYARSTAVAGSSFSPYDDIIEDEVARVDSGNDGGSGRSTPLWLRL